AGYPGGVQDVGHAERFEPPGSQQPLGGVQDQLADVADVGATAAVSRHVTPAGPRQVTADQPRGVPVPVHADPPQPACAAPNTQLLASPMSADGEPMSKPAADSA